MAQAARMSISGDLADDHGIVLSRVRRRRAELWSASVFVATAVTIAIALFVSASDLIPEAIRPGSYRAWVVMVLVAGLALSFLVYVLEKEKDLHTLTIRLMHEEARSAALSNRLSELSKLSELGKAVNTVLDLDDVLDVILSSAIDLIGGNDGSIMLLDESRHALSVVSHRGPREYAVMGAKVQIGEGISGRVAETGVPLLMQGDDLPNDLKGRSDRVIHSSICVPLMRRDELVGVLNLNETAGFRRFTEGDLAALHFFAEHAAIALANARLYETERDAVQRLAELDQMRSDFVATISHELRTPLTAIIGALKIMNRKGDTMQPSQRNEFMGMMTGQADRLMRLVEDVLVTARIEQGPRRVKRELLDLKELAESAIETVSMTDKGKKRHIWLYAEPTRPMTWGDPTALSQVLVNLLDNAVKYSNEGGRIDVVLKETEEEAIIEVADQGIGIPDDLLKSIFDRFRQVEGTFGGSGVGLGLYIVQNLVEAHGGTIEVTSKLGQGSTFAVRLPKRERDRGHMLAETVQPH